MKKSITGDPISRARALSGLGDPATWKTESDKVVAEFRKKPHYYSDMTLQLRVISTIFSLGLAFLMCSPLYLNKPNVYRTAQLSSVALEVIDGSGSGFVVIRKNKAGEDRVFLFTANHVMVPAITEAKAKIFLRDADYNKRGVIALDARLIARFEDIDIAVLQLGAGSEIFSRLQFADGTAQPGDKLFAVGSPHKGEHDNAIVDGIVSQVGFNFNEQIRGWSVIDQMSAQVNPGNSGGPVFNSAGRIIGVSIGTEHNGINFFVPVRAIRAAATAAGLRGLINNRGVAPSDDELDRRAKDQTYE